MTRPGVVVLVRNAFRPERDREVVPVPEPVTIRVWLDARGIDEFAHGDGAARRWDAPGRQHQHGHGVHRRGARASNRQSSG